ncbi:MAG: MFS transporter [Candidatus Magasanikbacteria bacterium]|jgi:MFS family permease
MLLSPVKTYFQDFGQLFKLPREFWAIQALNFVYCAFYFTFVTISALHLSQDVGFSDEGAGLLFGVFMFGTAIIQILMGPVVDRLGFRKTPLVAAMIITVGMLGIGFTPLVFGANNLARALMVLFYLVAMVGNGLMSPVVTAGVKRFSNSETRGAGFNMWYLTMNVGAMLTFVIDFMRRPLEDKATAEQLAAFRDGGGNSNIVWYLVGLLVVCWLVVYLFLKKEAQFAEFNTAVSQSKVVATKTKQPPFGEMIKEIWADKAFRKVLALLFFTIPAHIPFVAIFVIYPKYYTRVIAPDVNLGMLQSLNPVIIVVGLLMFAPLLKRFSVYWVLTVGMFIGGASCLVLAIPPLWLGKLFGISAIGDVYLAMVGVQIVIFSMGEFVWSPQLQAYVGAIAPEGKEGTYMGVTRYPYTLAKLLGGAIGGLLLAHYCPEGIKPLLEAGKVGYTDGPEFMNLILALFALSSPMFLILLRKKYYVDTRAEAS